MRNVWLTAVSVIIITLLLAATVMALPKMYLPEEVFDFGYTPQNSKISHVFWIKSVGEDSLKIVSVKPG
ncbi:MAG: DUF1573 domain-containing protein [FCB group bacterium]|nr:DUF1573 domain-containing protein [FCB group bacterium]